MYSDELNTYRIRVHRRKLWEDGCEELSRDFDVKKHLRAKFISEKGADGDGPRREFFFRMIGEMTDNAARIPQEDVKDHVLKVCFKWTGVYDG